MLDHVQVEVLGVDALTNRDGQVKPCVVLRDSRMRQLVIFLGDCEATAIGSVVDGRIADRPSIHDTSLRMLELAGAALDRVMITEALDDSYFATAELTTRERTEEFSLRPGDAVALALRAKCPIYVSKHIIADNALETVSS